ncbi:zinc metalloprotease [Pullulanibacillus camelliae]|uniref:Zinc metalloprotease n=1 Tax=Pullulanibacillus camelliae TaxID=1707096 RepID=A0A8J3DXU0_9BACL|nr:RIP metalloprotease RseP [Pullulanibacillus camelliae]GGE46273.1 zinc metalloprotease [Pullulanibacillus camelliae]
METFIAVVIIFGLLISFHELGHLLLAKRAGILCREFAIGFGPKIFSIKKKETVYTLRLLPIGGFVRMAGEDPEVIDIKPGHRIGLMFNRADSVSKIIINQLNKYPNAKMVTVDYADLEKDLVIQGYEEEEGERFDFPIDRKAEYVMDGQAFQIAPLDRQFGSKSLLDRILTIFAGPFNNFLLAFIVFVILFSIQGVPSEKPLLGKLISTDPAAQAGLQEGDRVLAINGQTMESFSDIANYINKRPNQALTLKIERDHHIQEVKVTSKNEKGVGIIGVNQPFEKGVWDSIKGGVTQTYYWIKMEVEAFKQLVTGAIGLDQLSGPVGIYNLTGQVVDHGIFWVMRWTAVLSINLGVVNLLPLPALDGGRLLFLFVEGLRGKPVDPKRETLVHFIGFAFLMLLMIVVTWNDIQKLFM